MESSIFLQHFFIPKNGLALKKSALAIFILKEIVEIANLVLSLRYGKRKHKL